jgi:hypothetical protein
MEKIIEEGVKEIIIITIINLIEMIRIIIIIIIIIIMEVQTYIILKKKNIITGIITQIIIKII